MLRYFQMFNCYEKDIEKIISVDQCNDENLESNRESEIKNSFTNPNFYQGIFSNQMAYGGQNKNQSDDNDDNCE